MSGKANLTNKPKGQKSLDRKDGSKPKKKQQPLSPFLSFTKCQYEFIQAADDLSRSLKSDYGEQVSINFYEKFLNMVPTLGDDHKALLHSNKEILDKYKKYLAAREKRDAERLAFRAVRTVKNIDSGLLVMQSICSAGPEVTDTGLDAKAQK